MSFGTRSSRRSAAVAAQAAIHATASLPPPAPSPPRRARGRALTKRVSYKEIPIDADDVPDADHEEEVHEEEREEVEQEEEEENVPQQQSDHVEQEEENEEDVGGDAEDDAGAGAADEDEVESGTSTPAPGGRRRGRSSAKRRGRAGFGGGLANRVVQKLMVGRDRRRRGSTKDREGEETGQETTMEEGDDDVPMEEPETVTIKKKAPAAATIAQQWIKGDIADLRRERDARLVTFRDKGMSVYETEHMGQQPAHMTASATNSRAQSLQPGRGGSGGAGQYPFPEMEGGNAAAASDEIGKMDPVIPGGPEIVVEDEAVTLEKRGVKRRRRDIEPGLVKGLYEPHTHMPHVRQDLEPTVASIERLQPLPLVNEYGDPISSFTWPNTTSGHTAFSSTLSGFKVGKYARGVMSVECVFDSGWDEWKEEVEGRKREVSAAERWAADESGRLGAQQTTRRRIVLMES